MLCATTIPIQVLLLERHRTELLRIRDLLCAGPGGERYQLHWVQEADEFLAALAGRAYDVCLVDQQSARAGLDELMQFRTAQNAATPRLLLTDAQEAAHSGAADALRKAQLDGPLLVRAIRHAIEQRRVLQSAREREEQFRAVFGGALDAMLIADEQGRYVDGNPAALSLLGVSAERLRELSVADVVVKQESSTPQRQWASFLEAGQLEGEVVLRCADGTLRTAEFRATANIMPGRHLSVLRDVTERRRTDEQLALSDRMACVGTLAAGVAHEINNPLMALTAKLELVQAQLRSLAAEAAPLQRSGLVGAVDQLAEAREAAGRVADIVRDIKIFSRAADEHSGLVDVHGVLDSTLRMAWNELRHRARLIKNYGVVPRVRGNESRLGQVFLNLIVNAAQAIPEGHADAHEVRVSTSHDAARNMAVIEIVDTGLGLSQEAVAQLFTPFFTTKPAGVGLGLGLAISRRLVTALGGEITVRSELGQGTAFCVALPIGDIGPSDAAPAPEPAVPLAASRRGRLLIVDDEPSICSTLTTFFGVEHDVQALTRASEALERIERGEQFDVILCDLMMPEMSGMELHRALRQTAPEAASRIVFWTGGAFTPSARDFVDEVENECLQKPFSLRKLRDLVNAKLASAPA